MPLADWDKCV